MRVEYIDQSEFIRRINEGIYDKEEFERALKWVKATARRPDNNPPEIQASREKKDKDWEMVVKMAILPGISWLEMKTGRNGI